MERVLMRVLVDVSALGWFPRRYSKSVQPGVDLSPRLTPGKMTKMKTVYRANFLDGRGEIRYEVTTAEFYEDPIPWMGRCLVFNDYEAFDTEGNRVDYGASTQIPLGCIHRADRHGTSEGR